MRENICVGIVAVGGDDMAREIIVEESSLETVGVVVYYALYIVPSRSYILPLPHLQDDIPHRPKQPLAMNIMDLNKQEYGVVNKEEWLGISLE